MASRTRIALNGGSYADLIIAIDGCLSLTALVAAHFIMRVQCLRCGHVGLLTAETLSRLAITPTTLIASFVKRLRCRRCGGRSTPSIGESLP